MPPDKNKPAWFLTLPAVAVAILCAGPFAIPLVWMSAAFRKWQKWFITILLLLITFWLLRSSVDLYRLLLKDMRDLQDILK